MNGFREVVHDCQLVDLGYIGSEYTWTDNREDEMRCRLYRALATQAWIHLFLHSRVCHLNPSKSDHFPIMVEIRNSVGNVPRKCRRFRFEEMWLHEASCEEIITAMWSVQRQGAPLVCVCDKIRATRVALIE